MAKRKDEETKIKGVYEKEPGSGIWWIRYADASGKIRREVGGSKSVARDLYFKRKAEIRDGKKLPDNLRVRKITFRQLLDDALAYSKAHKRSYADDVCRMKRIREWFSGTDADSITPQQIDERLTMLANNEGLEPATLNRYRSLMSLCFRLGMESGKVLTNPARLVRPRLEDNSRVRFLTESEESELRKIIRQHWPERELELDIALQTGLRRGGMYKLEWQDVDFNLSMLTERFGKKGKTRHIPLNAVAVQAFKKLREKHSGQGDVFDTKTPRHWFDRAVTKAGIENFHWHDLRHTFGSRLAMLGVPIEAIRKLMGHGSILVTSRYAHLAPSFEADAVNRLASFGQGAVIKFEKPTDTKTSTKKVSVG